MVSEWPYKIFNTYKLKIFENVPRMTLPVSNTELNFVEC